MFLFCSYWRQRTAMDWGRAIERNSEALKGILAALFAMLQAVGGVAAARIPRPMRRAVLRVLRPAESAVRRLIVIAARGMVAKPVVARPMPKNLIRKGGRDRLSFPLFDRWRFLRRRKPRGNPRIHFFPYDPRVVALFPPPPLPAPTPPLPAPSPPPDDGFVDARRLALRLEAVRAALSDLPGQARRLVRLRARREKVPGLRFRTPMRPGHPPGRRKKPVREVDHVLAECESLAWDALAPDTS
jgi:hypothetical protein